MQTFLKADWEDRVVVVIDIQLTPDFGGEWKAVVLDESGGLLHSVPINSLTNVSMLMLGGQPLDYPEEGGE